MVSFKEFWAQWAQYGFFQDAKSVAVRPAHGERPQTRTHAEKHGIRAEKVSVRPFWNVAQFRVLQLLK